MQVPATATVPGPLTVTATAGPTPGDETGFVVLTRGTDTRRIPFWFASSAPKLHLEQTLTLRRGGLHSGTTSGGARLVSSYRYPTGGDAAYPGPERVYRMRLTGKPANAGVVVLSGTAVPHITFWGSENHLAGYTALPLDLNPYRKTYGARRPVSAVVLPAHGTYDVVFDTRAGAGGPFTFRYWVNDVTPPKVKVVSSTGAIRLSAVDHGSGVDPNSIHATLDGRPVPTTYRSGSIRIAATPGRHRLSVTVADYQETKNMEDVPPILPNTTVLTTTVR